MRVLVADQCEAIVHLAARTDDDAPDLMATNLLGTWNVLSTARKLGIPRVVYMSSATQVHRGLAPLILH